MSGGEFAGKVIWVTGGTRGLGLAVAEALAERGARVAVSSRSRDTVHEVAERLSVNGTRCLAVPADVSDATQVRDAVAEIVAAAGGLDAVVAAAGISPVYVAAEELAVEDWRHVMDVNLSGTFYTLREASRPMLAAGSGVMVAVSSILGRVGTPNLAAYCASKGGVDQLVRALAMEWAGRGIRVNAVAPGYVETDMTAGLRRSSRLREEVLGPTPMKRFGLPSEIIGAVLFLISDASSYVTGASFPIDGGWSAG